MKISKTDNSRQWTYKANGSIYTITLDDTAEHWLLKSDCEPTGNIETGIVKLKGIPIEKIFEAIIDGEYKDYTFYESDIVAKSFDTAIQRIKNEG